MPDDTRLFCCPACDGHGKVVVAIVSVPNTYWEPGYDEEIYDTCAECNGDGYVEQDVMPVTLGDLEVDLEAEHGR